MFQSIQTTISKVVYVLLSNSALCFVQSAACNLYSPVVTEVGDMQDGLESQAEEQRQKQARAMRRVEKLQRDLRYALQSCISTSCLHCSAVMSYTCVHICDLKVPALAILLLLLCHLSTPDGWYAAINYVSVAACISIYTYASWLKWHKISHLCVTGQRHLCQQEQRLYLLRRTSNWVLCKPVTLKCCR